MAVQGRRHRVVLPVVGIVMIAVAAAACDQMTSHRVDDAPTIVVGSADFPENVLLAAVYSQALQGHGVAVTERFDIGSREVLYPQVRKGEVTVVPEYNGALLAFLDANATASGTEQIDTALEVTLPPALGILSPAAAEDKDSLTVTRDTADRYHLKSIGDLVPYSGQFTIGGPAEFQSRRSQKFKDTYGLGFKQWVVTGSTTAEALGNGSIQVADIFTTDPRLIQLNLVPLADPKGLFATQNVIPLVYRPGVNAKVVDVLNAVSAKLDTAGLVACMKRVTIDHEDPHTVAVEWLRTNGLD